LRLQFKTSQNLEGAWQTIILNLAEEILSTDIWFHFQSIEINLGAWHMFSCRQNDAEENLAKRGAWQILSHSFILHSNYRICTCPIPLE